MMHATQRLSDNMVRDRLRWATGLYNRRGGVVVTGYDEWIDKEILGGGMGKNTKAQLTII